MWWEKWEWGTAGLMGSRRKWLWGVTEGWTSLFHSTVHFVYVVFAFVNCCASCSCTSVLHRKCDRKSLWAEVSSGSQQQEASKLVAVNFFLYPKYLYFKPFLLNTKSHQIFLWCCAGMHPADKRTHYGNFITNMEPYSNIVEWNQKLMYVTLPAVMAILQPLKPMLNVHASLVGGLKGELVSLSEVQP